jgi:hypothetical protein
VRTPLLTLAAVAALIAPARAGAQPPPPEPSAIALVGRPYVLADAEGTLTLYFRLDRPLARRFDGEIRATAEIAGSRSSLARLDAGDGRGRPCYTAVAPAAAFGGDPADQWRTGALILVSVTIDGAPSPVIAARTRIREPRPGDARGLRLAC